MGQFLITLGRSFRNSAAWFVARLTSGRRRSASAVQRVIHNPRLGRGVRLAAGLLISTLRVALIGGLCAAVFLGALFLCFQRVPPATIGVLQTQWGGGIVERDFEPGLHFGLRGWQTWHVLDRRTHFAFFGAPDQGAEAPSLDLRTKEGNEIKVSVLVPYRIVPDEGHALVRDGLRSTYQTLVRATIKDIMMQDLGELGADAFANTPARMARVAASLPRLNLQLARYHVVAESIQIHQVDFREAYEQVLQKKQLTRQLALLATAATQVEQEMRASTLEQEIRTSEMRIRGEMDKQIETARSQGKLAISRVHTDAKEFDFTRRAQAQAEYERKIAEGDRALSDANALKERLTHAAYDSPGGRIDLARRAAENLRFREVVLNANDPRSPSVLDLGLLTQLLLGK